MTSFEYALEPSSCAAAALGPNTAIPRSASRSASPATSGASGPTTTRSQPSAAATSPSMSVTGTPTQLRVARDAGVARRAQQLGLLRASA